MLDLLIVLAFVAYAIYSGFESKKLASKNLNEYFLAGKTLKGWRAGVSMAATQYSADTPLLYIGLISIGGVFMLWQLWAYGIAFIVMGFVFSSGWRRSNVLTDAQLCTIRYSGGNSVLFLRCVKGIYYGTIINCVALSFVLIATTRYAEIFMPWQEWLPAGVHSGFVSFTQFIGITIGSSTSSLPQEIISTNNLLSIMVLVSFTLIYSTTGGLRSVVKTDVAQFFISLLGAVIYAWFILDAVGGLKGMKESIISAEGIESYLAMSSFSPVNADLLLPFFSIIAMQWFFQMNSDGTGYLAQRSMACENDREARIAAIVFTWLQIVVRSLIWLVIGFGLIALYPVSTELVGMSADQLAQGRELTYVNGINDVLPPGIKGLVLTSVLAALASTVDTHLNWGASYWSNDLYRGFVCNHLQKREPSDRELVFVARISTIVILLLAIVVMNFLGSIVNAWKTSLLFGAGMGSVLVLRWLWERINLYSEIAAMVASIVVAIVLLIYIPEAEKEYIRLAIMALTSTAAAILITFVTPATSDEVLDKFYRQIKPMGWWKKTSQRCGEETNDMQRLIRAIYVVLLCAWSVYFMLVGVGKLIIDLPDGMPLIPIFYILLSLSITPIWLRYLFNFDSIRSFRFFGR